jgi:molybdopterin molybdotransferase
MIPSGCDAVVPLEWTRSFSGTDSGQAEIEIVQTERLRIGLNLIPRGRSMRQGTLIAGSGDRLRPACIAVLAECGIAQPLVHRRPRVAVLSTGNELVEIDQIPALGQIRNSNAAMLCAQIERAGGEPVPLGIAQDRPESLSEKIRAGLECDFLCLSGGVSVGKFDLVPQVLADCQVNEVFHRVAMKPGKPCWFGIKPASGGAGRCHVFGLPGNPVSSLVCFELFVRFAISRFLGEDLPRPKLVTARLTAAMTHRADRPTWQPASLHPAEGQLLVTPTAWQGSFDLFATATGNCSLQLPAGESRWSAGALVQVLPWESVTAF